MLFRSQIQEEVAAIPDLRFERAGFRSFGDYGLIWEVVFHVVRPDLGLFQDRLHQVNMAILGRARKEGLDVCPGRVRAA